MKRITLLVVVLSFVAGPQLAVAAEKERFVYPPAPKSEQVDDYHGTKVADPYRDLENTGSEATKKWIEAENKVTVRLSRRHPGAEKDQREADGALELREIHGPVSGRRPLFLF